MKSAAVIVLVCGLAVTASAGPTPPGKRTTAHHAVSSTRSTTGGGTDALPFSDNFDSYVAGSNLGGQGTWQKWEAASVETPVSNTQSASGANSLKMVPSSDITQRGFVNSGKWELKCKTYYPSTNVGPGAADGAFIIGLNQFDNANPNTQPAGYWSAQVQWNPGTGKVQNFDLPTQNTPIIANQWVPFRMVIDLTTDKYDAYYNCVNFIPQRGWSTGTTATGGTVTISAFDFFSGNLAATLPFEFYVDDVTFGPANTCYANCDGSTSTPVLTANDFQCFLNEFASGTCFANCDGSTSTPALTANDFQCFLNAFATGCT